MVGGFPKSKCALPPCDQGVHKGTFFQVKTHKTVARSSYVSGSFINLHLHSVPKEKKNPNNAENKDKHWHPSAFTLSFAFSVLGTRGSANVPLGGDLRRRFLFQHGPVEGVVVLVV